LAGASGISAPDLFAIHSGRRRAYEKRLRELLACYGFACDRRQKGRNVVWHYTAPDALLRAHRARHGERRALFLGGLEPAAPGAATVTADGAAAEWKGCAARIGGAVAWGLACVRCIPRRGPIDHFRL
jgi:hypothetical protein